MDGNQKSSLKLVRLMVDADLEKEKLKLNGYANYRKGEDYVVP